jgi:hypothetical protein
VAEEQPGRLAVQQHWNLLSCLPGRCVTTMPPRAEWRAFHVPLRLRSGRRRVDAGSNDGPPTATRLTYSGAEVSLHHRRGRRLHIGDVVEPGADGVRRQVTADVDIDAE